MAESTEMILVEHEYTELLNRLLADGSDLSLSAAEAIVSLRTSKAQTLRDALLHEAAGQKLADNVELRGRQVQQLVHGMRDAVQRQIRASGNERLAPMLRALQEFCDAVDTMFPNHR